MLSQRLLACSFEQATVVADRPSVAGALGMAQKHRFFADVEFCNRLYNKIIILQLFGCKTMMSNY